jgi:hypothetical protein
MRSDESREYAASASASPADRPQLSGNAVRQGVAFFCGRPLAGPPFPSGNAGFFVARGNVSAEAWTAIATGVGVVLTLGGGFTVWMLRIDRAVMKASALPEALKALEARLMQAIQDLRGDPSLLGLVAALVWRPARRSWVGERAVQLR